MSKSNAWYRVLITTLWVTLGLGILSFTLELFYIQNLLQTGSDPIDTGSAWPEILQNLYRYTGFTDLLTGLAMLVVTIGYLYVTAVFVKSQDPELVKVNPRWIFFAWIVNYVNIFYHYTFLQAFNQFGDSTESEKRRNRILVFVFVGLDVIGSSISNQQLIQDFTSSSDVITLEEFATRHWIYAIESGLTLASALAFLLAVRPIQAALAKKQ